MIYAVLSRFFAAIYALLCGEKLSQKLCLWRKKDKYHVCCYYSYSALSSTILYSTHLHPSASLCFPSGHCPQLWHWTISSNQSREFSFGGFLRPKHHISWIYNLTSAGLLQPTNLPRIIMFQDSIHWIVMWQGDIETDFCPFYTIQELSIYSVIQGNFILWKIVLAACVKIPKSCLNASVHQYSTIVVKDLFGANKTPCYHQWWIHFMPWKDAFSVFAHFEIVSLVVMVPRIKVHFSGKNTW